MKIKLLEALEDMDQKDEQEVKLIHPQCDFFIRQIYFLHRRLKEQRLRQYPSSKPIVVPFAWVTARVRTNSNSHEYTLSNNNYSKVDTSIDGRVSRWSH